MCGPKSKNQGVGRVCDMALGHGTSRNLPSPWYQGQCLGIDEDREQNIRRCDTWTCIRLEHSVSCAIFDPLHMAHAAQTAQ